MQFIYIIMLMLPHETCISCCDISWMIACNAVSQHAWQIAVQMQDRNPMQGIVWDSDVAWIENTNAGADSSEFMKLDWNHPEYAFRK